MQSARGVHAAYADGTLVLIGIYQDANSVLERLGVGRSFRARARNSR